MKSEKPLPYRLPFHRESENLGKEQLLTRNRPLHRRISIDLQKLEGQSIEILDKAILKLNMDRAIPSKRKYRYSYDLGGGNTTVEQIQNDSVKEKSLNKDVEAIAKNLGLSYVPGLDGRQKHLSRIGKYHTQYAFLGELDALNEKLEEKYDDEFNFRLTVQKPYVIMHDALEELILRTVEGADDIRHSIKEIDRLAKSKHLKPPPRPRKEISRVRNLFLKNQTSMGFSTFKSVDKAYKDRNNAEQLLKLSRHVKRVNEQKKAGIEKTAHHKKNYKNEACLKKHAERVQILEELEARRTREALIREKTAALKLSLIESQEKARRDYKFALNFRSQIASVGKALKTHNFGKHQEEAEENNKKIVTELRNELENKRNMVVDYKQQQKIMRQNKTIAMKEDLDLKLIQNTARREVELRGLLKQHQEKSLRQLRSPTVLRIRELHPADIDIEDNLKVSKFHHVFPEISYETLSPIP